MKYNKETCEDLATYIVNNWDMDALVGFAYMHLTRVYLEDEELFHEDFAYEFEEEDEDEKI